MIFRIEQNYELYFLYLTSHATLDKLFNIFFAPDFSYVKQV